MDPYKQAKHLALRPLPIQAQTILDALAAPPRLVAHLLLVHDVAAQIIDGLQQICPALSIDREAALFGAAIHDIGKVAHPDELHSPGAQHTRIGPMLLCAHGVEATCARFAQTHEAWRDIPDLPLEDLLVALADTIWKGTRDQALEQRIIEHLVEAQCGTSWDIFLAIDDLVEQLTENAGERLAWQARF